MQTLLMFNTLLLFSQPSEHLWQKTGLFLIEKKRHKRENKNADAGEASFWLENYELEPE